MKKLLAIVLSLTMILSLAACAQTPQTTEASTAPQTETQAPSETPAPTESAAKVMTYEEFLAAELESEVTVQATVQMSAYNEENGNISLFMADEDGGAYFVYHMTVEKEDAKKMTEGAVLLITGRKIEWSGELEISEATYSFVEGAQGFISKPLAANLIMIAENPKIYNNARVQFTNVTIAASKNEAGEELPFLYQWNGAGQEGDDIYFKAAIGDDVFTFVVESDECGPETDLYKRVQSLEIGELVDLEGFLYWYEGPQPHIYSVRAGSAYNKSEGAMTFDEYTETELEKEVTVDAYVQQISYNETDGYVNLFLQDLDGAYYVYRMNVTPEEAEQITIGTHLKVSGIKIAWSGEIEISDGKMEILEGLYIAPSRDVSALIGDAEEAELLMNSRIALKGVVVAPSVDADGKEQPFLYKWNGSGVEGDDLYFNVTYGPLLMTLTVESDECGIGTEVYAMVKSLKIGDVIDINAFLYWYEGPQPHVYAVSLSEEPAVRGMSYVDYLRAKVDEEVEIAAYVQGFYYNEENGTANLYLAAPDPLLAPAEGSYYVYDMKVEKDDAEKFETGAPVFIKGFKTEWSGLPEIRDAEYSFEGSGNFVSEPKDITTYFRQDYEDGLEAIIAGRISLENAIVLPSQDAEGNEAPFLYKWNGSGTAGSNDDLYFTVMVSGHKLTVTVESSENPEGSEVYEAVTQLEAGDIINLEGFMYWYEGPQPHIYSVEPSSAVKEGAMGYGKYMLAQAEEKVTVEGQISVVGAYSEEKGINLYLEDEVGGYYIYNMPIEAEDLEKFSYGETIRVTGFKKEWSGMPEVVDVESYEWVENAEPNLKLNRELGGILGNEEALRFYIASRVSVENAYVSGIENEAGETLPYLYKWNGSGQEGDDIYLNLMLNGQEITCVLETDEIQAESEVYETVKSLKLYDVVDLEAMLYWYEGPQPHIQVVTRVYTKAEGAATYFDYLNAEVETPLTIDAYVQSAYILEKDGEKTANLFLHDRVGAYYVYGMKLEEGTESFEPGQRIVISGYRGEWSGEVELVDVESYSLPESEASNEDTYHADALNITKIVAEGGDLTPYMNRSVALEKAEVIASVDADGKEQPFLYNWNGSGQDGDDIYFKVKVGDAEMTLTVEADERPAGTPAYEAAKMLELGEIIYVGAYLYWYEGPQPHVQIIAGD